MCLEKISRFFLCNMQVLMQEKISALSANASANARANARGNADLVVWGGCLLPLQRFLTRVVACYPLCYLWVAATFGWLLGTPSSATLRDQAIMLLCNSYYVTQHKLLCGQAIMCFLTPII